MIGLVTAALAGGVELTVLAGGRSAPESTLLVPSGWEAEPSGLLAVVGSGTVGGARGGWFRARGTAWGYAPDTDVALLGGGLGGGWAGERAEVAARWDAEVYPLLPEASSLRAELFAHGAAGAWSGRILAVDRRFLATSAASFTAAEVEGARSFRPRDGLSLEAGLGAQANKAEAVGGDGPWGAQARARATVGLAGTRWLAAVEYRFTWAAEGESERERIAAFTPLGDYSDDVDALSGGGFLQHRVSVNGAVRAGEWTLAADLTLRLRDAEEEEERTVAYARIFSGKLRLSRPLVRDLEGFAAVGADSAAVVTGDQFVDAFGWVGARWTPTAKSQAAAR